MKKKIAFFLTIVNASAFAGPLSEQALRFVPGGTVAQEKVKEIKIKTPQNSIVEVEFHADGSFEEASGESLDKDIFVPADGLLSLKTTVAELSKQGKTPVGSWSLEKSFMKGWHYEFEGYENGQKFDYTVDARTGKLLNSEVDD